MCALVTGVQTCALPISAAAARRHEPPGRPLARHRQAPLAGRRQQGHLAGTGRRVRRLRRTHPPGRGERAEEDEGAVCGLSLTGDPCCETARENGPFSFMSEEGIVGYEGGSQCCFRWWLV